MLFGAILVAAAATGELVCDADSDDQVCLMQFMNRKAGKSSGTFEDQLASMLGEGHGHEHDDHHDHHHCPECPGKEFIQEADAGLCSHGGSDVQVLIDAQSIEEYYGDNVMMESFRYFIESVPHHTDGSDVGLELIYPDVHHHTYAVGTTRVRVDGYDLGGRFASCHRSVTILDTQAPEFEQHVEDLDTVVTVEFDEGKCSVDPSVPFKKYITQGFIESATDNCDNHVEIIRTILDDGVELDLTTNISGPGNRTIVYTAVDDFSDDLHGDRELHYRTTTHTVTLEVVDKEAPSGFTGCPNSTIIEIEAHETYAVYEWEPPVATGDNCDGFYELPPAVEQHDPKIVPGQEFFVGVTEVTYAFSDHAGNTMSEMCDFTITVIPKAHPVVLTCPPDVRVDTEDHADFGIVHWVDPLVMQHDKQLTGAEHIIYPQGVESGMPFPFGVTEIKITAKGEITGDRTREEDQVDECIFKITVGDPERPKVDGRMFRCESGSEGKPPFDICGGLEPTVKLFESYIDTFGYEVTGTNEVSGGCCRSEDGLDHECTEVPEASASSPAHYCTPVH